MLLNTDIATHGSRDKPEVLKALKEGAGELAKQFMSVLMTSLDQ